MKNNKGFFLAETIIVLALVTTAISFVLPNVTKVYENYKNTSKYYDQVEDIYVLKAISELEKLTKTTNCGFLGLSQCEEIVRNSFEEAIIQKTTSVCNPIDTLEKIYDNTANNKIDDATKTLLKFDTLYIVSYIKTPNTSVDYEFQKYLNRLKKTSYDTSSYRLIGVFEDGSGGKRYASIKIPSPCTP